MRLGGALNQVILQFNTPVQNGPWSERTYLAAKPLLANRTRKDLEYTFTILDSDVVNAFSHPGGYIYLTRGLFPFLGEDEETALQFVLAHEIAHVELKHMIQALQDRGVQKIDMGTLEKMYVLILPLAYPDKVEFAADRWAYSQLMRLDNSRYDVLKFLRKLKGYAEAHNFSDGRVRYEPRKGLSPVMNHLRAHPAAWKRLNELESLTDAASKPSR
jgi:Zn-dependent protease with chaperone function